MGKDEQGTTKPPMRDGEIDAAWVVKPPPLNSTIHLAPYDPAWPELFEREATRIRSILGDRVRLLEHTGSTSVPGLSAKPRIDITLALPDSGDESTYVPDLEAAGYTLVIREPEWFEHRVFKGPDTDINLHVFTIGAAEIDRMIRFRDWLRSHPEDLALYERTKVELAGRTWRFMQNYADAKSEVVEAIIARAEAAHAAAPGASDERARAATTGADLDR